MLSFPKVSAEVSPNSNEKSYRSTSKKKPNGACNGERKRLVKRWIAREEDTTKLCCNSTPKMCEQSVADTFPISLRRELHLSD